MNQINSSNILRDSSKSWKLLYLWASRLSLTMILLIFVQIIVFVVFPPPQSVEGLFQLFKTNWLLGLLSLDFIYILNNVILLIIYLALFVRLFRENPSICAISFLFGIVGIACYFPSNPAFEMLTLSSKYWNALPEAQSQYLAAGNAMLAGYTGTTFNVYYVMGAIALLLISSVILKSKRFSKKTGLFGIISGLLMIIPSTAGLIGIIFSLLSLLPWIVFLFLIARHFYSISNS